jgi:uncharacterized membrane protein
MEIDADAPEYESCCCDIDSDGRGPKFHTGDRVYVHPMKQNATVIRQVLHYDGPESHWGNVELQYDDGIRGTSHGWQVQKVNEWDNWRPSKDIV